MSRLSESTTCPSWTQSAPNNNREADHLKRDDPPFLTSFSNMLDAIKFLSYEDCETKEEDLAIYPSMSKVSDHTPAYNCHSYAWHSSSPNNKYWIPDPDIYMGDGSYTRQTSAGVGYKANWSGTVHSAIVQSVSGSSVTCISKWGAMGVYIHRLNDCPYYGTVRYWK